MTLARSLTFAASSPSMRTAVAPASAYGTASGTTILPGEDPTAFEKLHRQLIAELSPKGMLGHDVVATIARLVWRTQGL
jgi:hypothetical protein